MNFKMVTQTNFEKKLEEVDSIYAQMLCMCAGTIAQESSFKKVHFRNTVLVEVVCQSAMNNFM